MAQSAFKARAVPLYVSITTTAPVPEGQGSAADPGFLTSTTLVPSTFATGSFGWKGHKRMAVELPKAEEEGEGEKVHVTLTYVFHSQYASVIRVLTCLCRISATVIGSKDVKEGVEHEGEIEGTVEHAAEEAPGEAVGSKQRESLGTEVKEGEGEPPAGEEHAE